ncbi:Uncharacterized protein Fot_32240 [Forsythia ovata]|uniref:Uncharacterized protein n=1 Tax=Forsythia ovata TaxID=205694 RepID=A0ABD1T7S7_9LAMI
MAGFTGTTTKLALLRKNAYGLSKYIAMLQATKDIFRERLTGIPSQDIRRFCLFKNSSASPHNRIVQNHSLAQQLWDVVRANDKKASKFQGTLIEMITMTVEENYRVQTKSPSYFFYCLQVIRETMHTVLKLLNELLPTVAREHDAQLTSDEEAFLMDRADSVSSKMGYHLSNKAYPLKVALSSLQNSARNKAIGVGKTDDVHTSTDDLAMLQEENESILEKDNCEEAGAIRELEKQSLSVEIFPLFHCAQQQRQTLLKYTSQVEESIVLNNNVKLCSNIHLRFVLNLVEESIVLNNNVKLCSEYPFQVEESIVLNNNVKLCSNIHFRIHCAQQQRQTLLEYPFQVEESIVLNNNVKLCSNIHFRFVLNLVQTLYA